jgi:hypothetical protein
MADLTFTVTLDDSQLIAGLTNAENRLRSLGANTTQAFTGISAQLNTLRTGFDALTATVAKTASELQKLGSNNSGLANLAANVKSLDFTEAENKIKKLKSEVDNLGNSKTSVSGLTTMLSSLEGRLTGILGLEFGKKILEFANDIETTARAVGFTVPQLLEFQQAVIKAGGSAKAAVIGIEMFYMKLDQARQGGLQQQVAFERLGITLDDLKKFDDKTLFEKTIKQLAEMPDNAARSRIEVELLSRSFRGIPLSDIAKNMEETSGAFDKSNGLIFAANENYVKITTAINNFKLALLNVINPFVSFLDYLGVFPKTVEEAVDTIKKLVYILMALRIADNIILITGLAKAFEGLRIVVGAGTVALQGFAAAEVAVANATGLGAIVNLILKIGLATAAFFGIQKVMDNFIETNIKGNEKAKEAADAQDKQAVATMKNSAAGQQVYTQYARLNEAIKENTQNFIENQRRAVEKIAIQDQMAAKGVVEQKTVEESTKVYDAYAAKIDEVKSKLKEAQAARPEQEISRTAGTLRAQIKILEDAQKSMSEQAGKVAGSLAQSKLDQTQKKIFSDEDINVGKQIADLQVKLSELTMSTADRRLADIEKLKNADIARMTTELKNANNGIISDEQKAAVIEKVKKAYEDLIQAQERFNKEANTFDVGFSAAWQKFVDNAGTAADAGKMAFEGFSNGVDKAIDALTSRTKHSFKDMVADIILSMENRMLKNAFANMMGGLSNEIGGPSAGGLLSSLGLGGIATAFGLSGTAKNPVTPRSAVGFGDEPSAADAAVNASGTGFFSGIAASIGKFFGFADGGMVTTNSPVLVGERGPELISGAAGRTVTNASDTSAMLGGGTTHNHYYNINAVDAKSVATLFAENRMTMFGLVEQARRELPMRTR